MSSDTDKCPMCGSEMKWNAFSGSCTNIDCLFFVRTNAKELRIEMAYDTALHRIRELEAQYHKLDTAYANREERIRELEGHVKQCQEYNNKVTKYAQELEAKCEYNEAGIKAISHVSELRAEKIKELQGKCRKLDTAYAKLEERVRELEAERDRLRDALVYVHDVAHVASTGPEVPDQHWNILFAAQEALKK